MSFFKMAFSSNSRCQNRKERLNQPTNNRVIVEKAERPWMSESVTISNYSKAELLNRRINDWQTDMQTDRENMI